MKPISDDAARKAAHRDVTDEITLQDGGSVTVTSSRRVRRSDEDPEWGDIVVTRDPFGDERTHKVGIDGTTDPFDVFAPKR